MDKAIVHYTIYQTKNSYSSSLSRYHLKVAIPNLLSDDDTAGFLLFTCELFKDYSLGLDFTSEKELFCVPTHILFPMRDISEVLPKQRLNVLS